MHPFTLRNKIIVLKKISFISWTVILPLIVFTTSCKGAWAQKVNFPGGITTKAVGFSLNGQGYVGVGKISDGNVPTSAFYKYILINQ